MERNECVAMLLAGGQGSRLKSLTQNMAKPALSFGGKYRIIDFSLSNCVNSGIDAVGVLTQYKPFLLNTYVGIGSAWDLDHEHAGVHTLPPYMAAEGGAWYKGTANAIYQNMDFIDNYEPEYVLILSGDHIYKMDYSKMLQSHKDTNADLTIAVLEVPMEEANRFGIMSVDEKNKITKFAEKPKEPESNLASMGIYIFSWDVLKKALIEDEEDKSSENDFGKNVIPKMLNEDKNLYAYNFSGYWKDVGTISSYYEANMELLDPEHELDIFSHNFRVFSNSGVLPPQFIGKEAKVKSSLISNGCTILGSVSGSILAQGVYVGEGTVIEDSILLPYAKIEAGSVIKKSIIGENAFIGKNCSLGVETAEADNDGISIVENTYIMEDGVTVMAGEEVKYQKGM